MVHLERVANGRPTKGDFVFLIPTNMGIKAWKRHGRWLSLLVHPLSPAPDSERKPDVNFLPWAVSGGMTAKAALKRLSITPMTMESLFDIAVEEGRVRYLDVSIDMTEPEEDEGNH